ncbi:MAG: alpha/beta hydrolase [Cyclobacteriaceae bacterium]
MIKFNVVFQSLLVSLGAFLFMQGCQSKQDGMNSNSAKTVSLPRDTVPDKKMKDLDPKGEKPEWASDIKDNMQVVIEKLVSFNAPPIETSTAEAARKNPTPTDAVMAVMKENSIPMPPTQVDTTGKDITVKGGKIHARIYTPTGVGPFPVIVYYHGGGWVIANLDTYHASAQGLSEQAGAVVVSVHYRQGPEHKFPTAHNDSFAAYEWVTKNAESLNGDANRIAVVGESAGGNLAANVSIMARDKGIQLPVHQVLVYPIADNNMESDSYKKFANAKPLSKAMMAWFFDNYLSGKSMSSDPRIALVKANLKGLPPTTIINAGIDPLLSEGELLRDKLKGADVEVNFKKYDGVTHEFFGMAAIVPEAKEAQAFAAQELKDAFEGSARK